MLQNDPPLSPEERQRCRTITWQIRDGHLRFADLTLQELVLIQRYRDEGWTTSSPLTERSTQLPVVTPVGQHHHQQYRYDPDARKPDGLKSGLVHIINDDGSIGGVFRLKKEDAWWFRNACFAYRDGGVAQMGDDVIVRIPADKASLHVTTPTFSSCTFQSSKDYLKANHGIELDDSDRDWLAKHPYAEDMGVPQEYTPTAVDEMVSAYGMRISRLRIKAGAFFMGEALSQWMLALGCNPFAMQDHLTTNAEAAERLGMPLKDANDLWRFDFGATPLAPGVIGERALAMPSLAQSSIKRGGHASYLAPRRGWGEWFLSMQMDRERNVQWNVDVVYPEYVPRASAMTLNLYMTKGPNGRDLDLVEWYDAWRDAGRQTTFLDPSGAEVSILGEAGATTQSSATALAGKAGKKGKRGGVLSPVDAGGDLIILFDPADRINSGTAQSRAELFLNGKRDCVCSICKAAVPRELTVCDELPDVCLACYVKMWGRFKCPSKKCQLSFDAENLPYALEIDGNDVVFGCPNCDHRMVIDSKDKHAREVECQIWFAFDDSMEPYRSRELEDAEALTGKDGDELGIHLDFHANGGYRATPDSPFEGPLD